MNELSNGQYMDGIDQWPSLLQSTESPRTEMIYNIDPGSPNSKVERYKTEQQIILIKLELIFNYITARKVFHLLVQVSELMK